MKTIIKPARTTNLQHAVEMRVAKRNAGIGRLGISIVDDFDISILQMDQDIQRTASFGDDPFAKTSKMRDISRPKLRDTTGFGERNTGFSVIFSDQL